MSPEEPPSLLQELSQEAYPEIVRLLVEHLPAKPDAPPAALDALHRAAIAHAASMLPVNAEEAYMAAHCVIARARAEEALAEIPRYPLDTDRIDKLTRQFALMERTANSLRAQLLRVQAVRQKRDSISKSCTEDEWTAHIAAKLMLIALGAQQKKAAEKPPAQAADPPPPELFAPDDPAALPESWASPELAEMPELSEMEELTARPDPIDLPETEPEPEPASEPEPEPEAELEPEPEPEPEPDDELPLPFENDDDYPPRDLALEAEHYAIHYPDRAQLIRSLGALPEPCTFGPPDDELLHAIITGTTPKLRSLDVSAAAFA